MKKHRHSVGKKKSCPTRKVRYRDHQEAVVALNQTAARRNLGISKRAEIRTYFCHLCNGHHLTSRA